MAEFIQKHKLFSFYSILMILVVLIAIFAPWLAPGDAFSSNLSQALQAPSSQHWFGTDKLGRDVLSRIIMVLNYPCSWVLPLLSLWLA